MVVAIIGIILMLALLPQILALLKLGQSDTQTQDQIATEKLEEKERQEKGALCNTVDFVFGEGTCSDLDEAAQTDVITGDTPNESRVKMLEDNFEDIFGEDFKLGDETIINPKTGTIESDTPPTFKLSDQDIANINESRIAQGLEPLGVQSEIISEVIEIEASSTNRTGTRKRFGE